MTRKDRDDKRKAPTIDPNPHYWADIIFKNLRPIIAGIIVLVSIALFAFADLTESVIEVIKYISFLSAGFLFGNAKSS
ncbi:hypothetical protein [Phocaeicola plebeius]|jgi:hypothetical protein|uniref:hypothetical protein n=1 Tax=Phocaeicola plebeius TaxID=310297 RepID=UPI0026ED55FF|nr:hypothetical protein [Phocaeicola plebeius]MCI6050046.1 hypothetical protein [Phocaeicola plebeius]MDD6914059.1 hypothetical protein [Phocaeicola plebeius]MDY5979482.1 hypothetical protein [Phocaeicola plebeius]